MRCRKSKWDRPREDQAEWVGPTPEMMGKPMTERDPVWAMAQNGKRKQPRRPYLTSDQEWCVEEFRRLYSAFLAMRVHPRGVMQEPDGRGGTDGNPADTVAYREAVTAITQQGGRQTFDAIVNVAVFRRWPGRRLGKFLAAVEVLEVRWLRGKRRAAKRPSKRWNPPPK